MLIRNGYVAMALRVICDGNVNGIGLSMDGWDEESSPRGFRALTVCIHRVWVGVDLAP